MILRITILLAGILASLMAFAQGNTTVYLPPTLTEAQAVQQQGRYLGTIDLERGITVEIVFEGRYMPFTVANIKKLADAHFYDNLSFHRILPNSLIQTGDPYTITDEKDKIGTGGPGYTINIEVSPFLTFKPGAVAMANVSNEYRNYPNSGGSHIFMLHPEVSTALLKYYQGLYAVCGWVKGDIDVIDKIVQKDRIKNFTLAPYAGTEECPLLVSGATVVGKQ